MGNGFVGSGGKQSTSTLGMILKGPKRLIAITLQISVPKRRVAARRGRSPYNEPLTQHGLSAFKRTDGQMNNASVLERTRKVKRFGRRFGRKTPFGTFSSNRLSPATPCRARIPRRTVRFVSPSGRSQPPQQRDRRQQGVQQGWQTGTSMVFSTIRQTWTCTFFSTVCGTSTV